MKFFGKKMDGLDKTSILRLNQEETVSRLSVILSLYILERVSWLLTDLKRDEVNESNKEEVTLNQIQSQLKVVVPRLIQSSIYYDDAKELLLQLSENNRFLPGTIYRRKLMLIMREVLNDLGISGVKYNHKTQSRELKIR